MLRHRWASTGVKTTFRQKKVWRRVPRIFSAQGQEDSNVFFFEAFLACGYVSAQPPITLIRKLVVQFSGPFFSRKPPTLTMNNDRKCYSACSPEEFCEYFFRVCLGILHWKMAGIFGEFFRVSVSHETKHEKSSKNSGKIRSKIRGKIRDENSKNSGNFRSATFLT